MAGQDQPSDSHIFLERAEKVLVNYASDSLISDEAELLRACLYALVAIAHQLRASGGEAGL